MLQSDAPHKDKADACRRLGVIGTGQCVPVLAGLLGDEKLAHMARYGLEPIPDASVDEALRAGAVRAPSLPNELVRPAEAGEGWPPCGPISFSNEVVRLKG